MVHPSRFGRIAAVALLALSSMCVRAQAQIAFSTPENISNNADNSKTPQVAVDGAGNIYVVWEDDTASNSNILFSRSGDGGLTFSAPQNVSGSSGSSSNPRISVDAQGGINVVWVNDGPGNNDIFFSRSMDGGGSFSQPVNVSNDPADSLSPQLAVDASGNISIVWENDSSPFGVLYSHSTDGVNFSQPLDLATNTGGSFGAQIGLGADGSINVVWEDDTSSGSNISYNRSTTQGASFSGPKSISGTLGNSFEAQITVDVSGNIDVVWADSTSGVFDVFFSRSTDQGANFSGPTNLSNGPANSLHAQIGADATGGVYVVWQENVAADFNNRDIFFARSSDSGANFMAPTNLSNNLGNSTSVWITVDATGAINLSWQDTTPGVTNIFFARSENAGTTFLTQNLSNDSGASSDARIAADKSGNVNVVWSDNASGVSQVLFSRFNNPQAIKHPPVANAGMDQVLECAGPGGTPAKLDGSASTDPSGSALSYVWTDELGNVVGNTAIATVTVAMGTHAFTLTVTDAAGLTSAPATTHVTVQDTMPPTLSVTVTPNALWPPNHKLVPIAAAVVASDTCDANPTVKLVSITSSDALNAGDIQAIGGGPVPFGTDVRAFELKSERSNSQSVRIYTITYAATDASGHTTMASAQVQVAPPTQWVPLTKVWTKTPKHHYEKKDEDDKKDREDKDRRHEDER